jgi:hypothetical protein
MYKQGRRFAEGSSSKVTAFDLAAMQARSYLAAINALSLVEEHNAWIALPASLKTTRVSRFMLLANEIWTQADSGRSPNAAESARTSRTRSGPRIIARLIS